MEKNFYEMVYELVRLIPAGRVCAYGTIAKSLGAGGTARMVGFAMRHAGEVYPAVPAHRVVNSSGLLTGKFHFNPPESMAEMLFAEGVEVINDKVVNFKQVHWDPRQEL